MAADFSKILLLAAMPAIGNFAGGLIAEVIPLSARALSFALHAAAGIVVAVVGVELMPTALQAEADWVVLLAFVLGGLFSVALDSTFEFVSARFGESQDAGPWKIYVGVSTDLFTDGLMIGTASVISIELGLLIALGQIAADIPEGFASIAAFRNKGVTRIRRIVLSASFAVPVFMGATLGYGLVRDSAPILQYSLLSFAAAILMVTAVEKMMGEAHESIADARWEGLIFTCGFALFILIANYLG